MTCPNCGNTNVLLLRTLPGCYQGYLCSWKRRYVGPLEVKGRKIGCGLFFSPVVDDAARLGYARISESDMLT